MLENVHDERSCDRSDEQAKEHHRAHDAHFGFVHSQLSLNVGKTGRDSAVIYIDNNHYRKDV